MREWEIYALSDPRTGSIRYVGCTHCGRARLLSHLSDARKGMRGRRCEWLRELLALGMEPSRSVLESGAGDSWQAAERRWIAELRAEGAALTNIAAGGEGKPGFSPAPSTVALRSARNRGRKDSPEARARKSAARIGMKFTAEHRANMSRGKLGKPIKRVKPVSAEHRAALSAAHMGKRSWPNGRVFSDATRAKMAAAKLGTKRTFSDLHRERLSIAARKWRAK